jgi:hypothetical protein
MRKCYVFKYSFNMHVKSAEGVEEVPTHAVAVVPAEACTVLIGGGSTWVHHVHLQGVDTYAVEGDVACYEAIEAIAHAQELQRALMEQGTIAPDPRIPPPLEKRKLKVVR